MGVKVWQDIPVHNKHKGIGRSVKMIKIGETTKIDIMWNVPIAAIKGSMMHKVEGSIERNGLTRNVFSKGQ